MEKGSSKDPSAWNTSMKGLLGSRQFKVFHIIPTWSVLTSPPRHLWWGLLWWPESHTQGHRGLEKLRHQPRAHTASRWQTGMKAPPSATCLGTWPGAVWGQSLGSPRTRFRPCLLSLRCHAVSSRSSLITELRLMKRIEDTNENHDIWRHFDP